MKICNEEMKRSINVQKKKTALSFSENNEMKRKYEENVAMCENQSISEEVL